ncbi:hypothetical protein [Altericista sp. CCNU0014]|uniref:hypothetical protein n=1 Tax=Altericista sp. CCNU0014 TaxID=3082949 RepID=UPI00384E6BCB
MKRSTQILKLSLVGGSLVAIWGTNAAPLLAQSTAQPLGGSLNGEQDLNNIFTNRDQSASSLFGLINKIQLLNGRNPNDFAAEQDENFQSAVSEFRQKQQQKTQSPVAPSSPISSPSQLP